RTLDPRPRVLLQRRAACGVVAVDRADQGLQPAGEEVLHLALRRDLADLAVDDVADHRQEHEDQPIPQLLIAGAGVAPPDREHLVGRGPRVPPGPLGGCLHSPACCLSGSRWLPPPADERWPELERQLISPLSCNPLPASATVPSRAAARGGRG